MTSGTSIISNLQILITPYNCFLFIKCDNLTNMENRSVTCMLNGSFSMQMFLKLCNEIVKSYMNLFIRFAHVETANVLCDRKCIYGSETSVFMLWIVLASNDVQMCKIAEQTHAIHASNTCKNIRHVRWLTRRSSLCWIKWMRYLLVRRYG